MTPCRNSRNPSRISCPLVPPISATGTPHDCQDAVLSVALRSVDQRLGRVGSYALLYPLVRGRYLSAALASQLVDMSSTNPRRPLSSRVARSEALPLFLAMGTGMTLPTPWAVSSDSRVSMLMANWRVTLRQGPAALPWHLGLVGVHRMERRGEDGTVRTCCSVGPEKVQRYCQEGRNGPPVMVQPVAL